ncbi:hypothetical protein VB005_09377 [Metarhizium brunneum]
MPHQTDISAVVNCANKVIDALNTLPIIPPELDMALSAEDGIDECNYSVPSSLSSDYSFFTSSASSWANKYKSELSTCPGFEDAMASISTNCFAEPSTTASNRAIEVSTTETASLTQAIISTTTTVGASAASTTKTGRAGRAGRKTGMAKVVVVAAGAVIAGL